MAALRLQQQRRTLQDYVNSRNDVQELLPILQHVDILAQIKPLINAVIEQCDATALNRMYHNSLPLGDVIPDDLLRHVLSFADLYCHRAVSKKWNELSKSNTEVTLRNMYRSVSPSPKHDTWILHPRRRRLHPIEIAAGFRGPFNDITSLFLAHSRAGDTILVHDGRYVHTCQHGIAVLGVNHNVAVVGLGAHATIEASLEIEHR